MPSLGSLMAITLWQSRFRNADQTLPVLLHALRCVPELKHKQSNRQDTKNMQCVGTMVVIERAHPLQVCVAWDGQPGQ